MTVPCPKPWHGCLRKLHEVTKNRSTVQQNAGREFFSELNSVYIVFAKYKHVGRSTYPQFPVLNSEHTPEPTDPEENRMHRS